MIRLVFILLFLFPITSAKVVCLCKPKQIRIYDINKKISLFVVADLMSDSNKSIKKRPSFHYDPDLPRKYQANNKCFYKSGYDRGHIIADRWLDYNKTILYTTYEFTNIIPELPKINRVKIAKFERFVDRTKCKDYKIITVRIIPSNKRIKPNCPVIPKQIIYHFYCDGNETDFKVIQEVK